MMKPTPNKYKPTPMGLHEQKCMMEIVKIMNTIEVSRAKDDCTLNKQVQPVPVPSLAHK